MFFPLGLGFSVPKNPIMTMFIILLNIYCYYFFAPNTNEIKDIIKNSKEQELIANLFADYCLEKKAPSKVCAALTDKLASSKATNKKEDKVKSESKDKESIQSFSDIDWNQVWKFINIFNDFNYKITNDPDSLSHLRSYPDYRKMKINLKSNLQTLFKRENLLSTENITPQSLLKAQFGHGSFIHLLFNMVILFIFGMYVENRLGSKLYSLFYLVGGFFSLGITAKFFLSEYTYLVGASGNIFSVMGMFFILFFRHKMKFVVFYIIAKTVYIPIRYAMPFLYLASEFTTGKLTNGLVAYQAHISGFLIGSLIALIILRVKKVASPYLYLEERNGNSKEGPEFWLQYNPRNPLYGHELLHKELQSLQAANTIDDYAAIIKHATHLIDIYHSNKDYDSIIQLIDMLPIEIKMEWYLTPLSLKRIIQIGDYSFDTKNYLTAIRFYNCFTELFPNHPKVHSLEMTVQSILTQGEHSESFWNKLDIFTEMYNNKLIKKIYSLKDQ